MCKSARKVCCVCVNAGHPVTRVSHKMNSLRHLSVVFLLTYLAQYQCRPQGEETKPDCSAYKNIKDPELSLFEAASSDNLTAVKCLIDFGTNASAVVTGGFTPIHASASRGNIEISRTLVEGGARVNVHDSIVGLSPLHSAAGNNHLEIAVLLLGAGANVNDMSKMKMMPLQVAASNGFTDMSRLLLDNGASINVKDRMGHTPLHIAASRGDKSLVELLVQRGADLSAKTIFGKTAHDMAAKYPEIRSRVDTLLRERPHFHEPTRILSSGIEDY